MHSGDKKFDQLLVDKDPTLLALFPGLRKCEKGKTYDEFFIDAVEQVVDYFWDIYGSFNNERINVEAIKRAYTAITNEYDKYSSRSYLIHV